MGSKKTKTTSKIELPLNLFTKSTNAINNLESAYNQVAATAAPSQYVQFDPATSSAMNRYSNLANTTSEVPGYVLDEYRKTIEGKYLSPESNPYIREIANRASLAAANPVHSGFATAGRFGSGAYGNALADATAGTTASIYGNAYEAERQRMAQAQNQGGAMTALSNAEGYRQAQTDEYVGRSREANMREYKADQLRAYYEPFQEASMYNQVLAGSPLNQQRTQINKDKTPFDWGGAIAGMLNPMQMIGGMMPGGGGG